MELRRGVGAALLSALSQGGYPVLFGHLDWPGAPVRAHTGVGQIEWGGEIWHGVGTMGNVELPEEASEIAAVEALLSLAGVPADLDGYADDVIRGRVAEIYIGAVAGRPGGSDGQQATGLGSTLIGTPVRLFSGIMDALTLSTSRSDDGVEHSAQVTAATGQEARSGATIYHCDEDQRRVYPTDTAGRLVILAYAKAQKTAWPEN